jgi:UDP-N-acetylglucosamine acyltransferase
MTTIHPSTAISGTTEFGKDVEIGPYCTIDGPVKLGDGVRLIGHIYLKGPIEIGARTVIHPFSSIGFAPQDVKYKPELGTPGVKIGEDCLLREGVTIHAAGNGKPRPTTVGNRCFLMVSAHMGHDSMIGDDVVLVNNTALGGHVEVGDRATIGGGAVVHQFCRIGRLAFIGGASAISTEVPPFCLVWGRNRMAGLNVIGMRRSGMPREDITTVRRAFREAIRSRPQRGEMMERLLEMGKTCGPVMELYDFVRTSTRAIAPYASTSHDTENESVEG